MRAAISAWLVVLVFAMPDGTRRSYPDQGTEQTPSPGGSGMGHLSSDGEPDENGGVARGRGGKVVIDERRGEVGLEVRLDGETLWLTLAQMAELFARDKSVVSRHLANIFRSKELDRVSAVAENATTAADGKTYAVKYYNLDAILSVGYRVNSKEGTRFRIWASRPSGASRSTRACRLARPTSSTS